jgi:hypothetical protein
MPCASETPLFIDRELSTSACAAGMNHLVSTGVSLQALVAFGQECGGAQ